jgi:beta-propeller repeat-containing protein
MSGTTGSWIGGIRRLPAVGALACAPVVVGAFFASSLAGDANPHRGVSNGERQRLAAAYGRLPLSFEANRGQSDARVRFLAHGPGYGLFFTSQGPVLALRHSKSAGAADVVRLRMLGASVHSGVVGVDRRAGVVNYSIGSDRSHWRTGIPTFSRVRYEGAWPGVSVDFYGNGAALEYDLRLAVGADPARIGLAFPGARSLRLTSAGDLQVGLSQGLLLERRPVAYQWLGPRRKPVSAGYVVGGGGQVHLGLGAYDHSRPLIVDPGLVYSSYLGGANTDHGTGIAVNSGGNAYVTGYTASPDFPTTMGAAQTSFGGGTADAFVTELDATGSAIVYSTYLGGNNADYGTGIAVDSAGNAYLTGTTNSADFPTTTGAYQTSFPGYSNCAPAPCSVAFVSKLDSTGGLSYSTYLGGEAYGQGIAVDSSGDAYVTGVAFGGNFPTTAGAYQTSALSGAVAFVTKLNPTGTALSYSTFLGGSGSNQADGIAVDSGGNAYVTGATSSSNFPTTPGAYQTACNNCSNRFDAFVTKLNATGTALLYSTYLAGSNQDIAWAIAVDSGGNAYVTGETFSSDFPTTTGAYQTSLAGRSDAFVTKLNATATALTYSTYLGGSGGDGGLGIAVDSTGDAYVTGGTSSSNFPTTAGAYQTSYSGNTDAFVTKLNAAGSALSYSTYLGGSGEDAGRGIAVDNTGDAYVTGGTSSTNFPTTAGAYQSSYSGNTDAFVTKIAAPAADPAISAQGSTFSANEGAGFSGAVATFTDPDTKATAREYSASIKWGDGGESTGTVSGSGGKFEVSGSHTYAEEGTYTVTVTITDVDNATNTAMATSTAKVADAALASKCAAPTTSTQAFSGPTARFTDEDPGGMSPPDYTATIEWGDSSSSPGTASAGSGHGPYTVSGSHVYTSTGTFTITTTIEDAGGSQTVAACKTLVFAVLPGGGSFVIGDENATIGKVVTFSDVEWWGSNWWKENTLSDGPAPAAFKGFAASSPSPPTCGETWTTNTGNGSGPPATVPEYIAVIAASKIAQSGSTITGNAPEVVVVKTNPGYLPNPGHKGTGKVIAIVCKT